MSSISSFVTGYRNNDWGLVFLSSHWGLKGKWYIFIYIISSINKNVIESSGYLFCFFEILTIY